MGAWGRALAAPAGPWGASQGALGGSRPQTTRVTFPSRPFGFASTLMSILMSIWGRLGVDLGSLLGVMLGSFWRLFRPKLVSEPSSNRLIFEKVMFTKHYVFQWLFAQIDPKMGPRSTQDRSKMGPRSSWVAFFSF